MNLYKNLINKKDKVSIIGLGYVGMPIGIAFAKKVDVIGYDLNSKKIEQYLSGVDPTNEVGNNAIKETTMVFTDKEDELKKAKFHIVAVPTPINGDKTPDLKPVIGASELLGRNLVKGSIVVYESTVYPGVTEEVCIPILEKESGLICGVDFKVGYSPERINPGDKDHRLETIVKIVSGIDDESLDTIAKVYELVIEAGVHRASSIKVAEAAKVVENSQRDINIAFMNELAIVFNMMGIDTNEVLEAAATKWNFLEFYPGLVGGHCIGVDPYYFVYRAEQLGYHSQIILSGRKINDDMPKFIVDNIIKSLIKSDKKIKGAKTAILGVTFKENCPDTRNSKVVEVIDLLKEYDLDIKVIDPVADKKELKDEYNLNSIDICDCENIDVILVAVSHEEFKHIKIDTLEKISNKNPVIVDLRHVFNKDKLEKKGFNYWCL